MRQLLLTTLIVSAAHGCNNNRQGVGFTPTSAEVRSSNKTQSFTLNENKNRLLDILIVVDSSGSMDVEHNFLRDGLEPLLSAIEGSDWRIAVTTSEPFKCFLDRIILPTSEANAFGQLIRDAVEDRTDKQITNYEQLGLAAIKALRGECLVNYNSGMYSHSSHYFDGVQNISHILTPYQNDTGEQLFPKCAERKTWVRRNSILVVLMISDEDIQSITERIGGSLTDLYFYLESIRKIRSTAHVYALLNPSSPTSKDWNSWKDDKGESLFSMVGELCDSCSQDQANAHYKKIIEDMSRNVSAILTKNYTLDHAHNEEDSSVVLYYGDGESKNLVVDRDYKIEGNTLTIISNLPENSKRITVSYSYNPDA